MFSSDDPQAYYQKQYFAVIDEILGKLSSRFSQPAMKTLEFIETIILDAANDRLQSLSTDSAAAVETLSVYGNIIDFQKLDSQLHMLPSVIATVNDEMSQRDTSKASVVCTIYDRNINVIVFLLKTYAQKSAINASST